MHLALYASNLPVGLNNYSRVVVQARSPLLEEAEYDDHTEPAGHVAEHICTWAGDSLCEVEV